MHGSVADSSAAGNNWRSNNNGAGRTGTNASVCLRGASASKSSAAGSSASASPPAPALPPAEVHLCRGFLRDSECEALISLGREAFITNVPPQWTPEFAADGGGSRVASSSRVLTVDDLKADPSLAELRAAVDDASERILGTKPPLSKST